MMRTLFLCFLLWAAASAVRAQPVDIRVSDPGLRDPEEVSIALNPKNLNELAVGANIWYLFTSSNAGLDWDFTRIHSQYGVWGDPCLMYDDSGILYYEHLSGDSWQDPEFLYRIVIQNAFESPLLSDGTETGLAPPTMQDKAWLGLDRSSTPSKGSIYTSWTEFDKYGSKGPLDSSRIYFSKSTDHNTSWSERVRVDDTAGDCLDSSYTDEGATTAAGKDGTIFCAWSARNRIYLDQSTDHGKTFGKDRIIADQPGGWDFNIPGINRANGFAMIASDLNVASKYYGRLYVMWSDQRRGVTDVYFTHSTDNGDSWSAPLRVNTDSSLKHHFFPSMALDPVTGRIYIVYYDRRNYDDERTDVYLARSIDGGASFTDSRISESAFDPADTVFFGDYIHIVAHNGHVYPVWMREDFADARPLLSVWTAAILDTSAVNAPHDAVAPGARMANKIAVRQHGTWPSLSITLASSSRVSIDLFDLLGRRVENVLSGDYGAGEYRVGVPHDVASGAYIVRMTATSQINAVAGSSSSLVTKVVVP